MAWHDRDYNRDEPPSGLGARLTSHSVVMWLLVINFAVYVLDMILSSGMRIPEWMSPYRIGNFNVEQAVLGGQIWRFVTYQFLHAGFLHVAFNMLGLYFFGPMLERWWGSRRFLAFYLLCGISGAFLMSPLAFMPAVTFVGTSTALVGASGSIFGILIGAAVLYPKHRVMLLFPPIPMSMRTMALVFVGIAFFSMVAGTPNAGGEAAHLGGALLGFILCKKPRLLDWADRVSPGNAQLKVMQKRAANKRAKQDALQAEVDRILAKVSEHGLHSLTRKEKKTLQQATDEQRRAG